MKLEQIINEMIDKLNEGKTKIYDIECEKDNREFDTFKSKILNKLL